MQLGSVLLLLALLCFLASAPVIGFMFYLYFRIGQLIGRMRPALWEEMRSGFYTDLRVSQRHNQRFRDFLLNGECAQLGIPGLEQMVHRYKFMRTCTIILVTGGPIAAVSGLLLTR
jgi:hypothetical protein